MWDGPSLTPPLSNLCINGPKWEFSLRYSSNMRKRMHGLLLTLEPALRSKRTSKRESCCFKPIEDAIG